MKLCRIVVEGKTFILKKKIIMADIFYDVSIFLFFRKMLISAKISAIMNFFLPYYKENN